MKPAERRRRRGSLRARLLWALLVPLSILTAIGALLDARNAGAQSRQSHDRALVGIAIGVAARLETDRDGDLALHLFAMMRKMKRFSAQDQMFHLVRGDGGAVLSGDPALLPLIDLATDTSPALVDGEVYQEPVRAAVYAHQGPDGRATVVVAETLHQREAEYREALVTALGFNIAMAAATLLAAWVGVSLALAPLAALSQGIAGHDVRELAPVSLRSVPAEVRPVVHALNGLIRRVRRTVHARHMFINDTAHQLRTPVAGLLTQAQLLQREAAGADAQRRAAEMVNSAQRLSRLVHQLLSLARADEDAARRLDLVEVDLAAVLQDAGSACLDGALAAGIDLGFEPATVAVRGVPWMLRELMVNLIGNAVAHTGPRTVVTARCGRGADGRPFFEVEDDGPGIPPQDRERVFERFVQLGDEAQRGTGLGLAIAREIALRHKASLTLHEGTGGRGLRARVTFPPGPPPSEAGTRTL